MGATGRERTKVAGGSSEGVLARPEAGAGPGVPLRPGAFAALDLLASTREG